jgi:hypothetical protein
MSRKRKTPQTRAKQTNFAGNTGITHFISPGPLTGGFEKTSSVTTLPRRLKFNSPQKRHYLVLTNSPQDREYAARSPKILGQTLPVVIMALAGSIAWLYGPRPGRDPVHLQHLT